MLRDRCQFVPDAAGEVCKLDRAHGLFGSVWVKAREREKLLHEAGCSIDALVEALEAFRLCFRGLRALRKLDLELKRRERRAQLVRRIGRKALLSA